MSNTEGDSGETTVIKNGVLNAMPLIYFDSDLLPYSTKSVQYPRFNYFCLVEQNFQEAKPMPIGYNNAFFKYKDFPTP
jgi:hypothetical protein